MKQVNQNINTSLLKIKNYSDDVIISDDVNEKFPLYKTARDADKAAIRLDFSRIMQLKFLNIGNINDALMIFMKSDDQPQYDICHMAVYYQWEKESIERIMQLNNQKENRRNFTLTPVYSSDSNDYDIIVGRKIGDGITSKTLGHLLIAVDQEYLRSIYKDIDIGKGSNIFIIDSNGLVVSASNPDIEIGQTFAEVGLIETIQSENRPVGSTFSMQLNNEETLISYSTIGELKWYIVSTIPYSYLNSEASEFAYKIIVLTIAIIFIAIMFSFIISQSITAPLKKLEKNMIEFGEGKMNRLLEEDRDDEIGSLQKSFNSMSKDIKRLLENIDEENRRRRITELKVLEYQINPHFLYNTLDSINWMALKAGHPDISAMVTALARFFRLGLSKGKELYTINDEIEHVHNYLIISTTRYKDCFKYHIDVDPLILELKTIKIILQPLVENAIKHGIVKNKSNQGLISIVGRKKGCDIYLEVEDNGKGIDEEQLIFINRALKGIKEMSTDESGFGLFNVNQRIRLHYGKNYGLSIESQLDKGTIVRIVLPALE